MNQELLVRLFRSIEGEPTEDIVLVAEKIIEDETKKGHIKLANKLSEILKKNIKNYTSFRSELKTLLPQGISIPKDKRYNIPLATHVDRDSLRHYMVLPLDVEGKIQRIEKEFAAKDRLGHYGLSPKQKILLYGAPGCGKSMAAERIAWTIGLPFLKVRFEAIISSYLGESASNLNQLFESIKSFPCVLLLDEFDFIAKARSTTGQDVGEMHRLVNLLLNLLEDYKAPGILVATTNFEGIIDHALFRRFDEIIEMPKPSEDQISKILIQTLSAVSLSKHINWHNIINSLIGASAATVVKIANDAAKFAIIKGEKVVEEEYLITALRENAILIKK
ncbi:AAA family ATPase [Niastella yeongjuensis]|uniref:AAA family ATPase n=1 Tax=Niastella yeongjuensis TaxID=354355 RepID=A0A1V9ESB1_9BACT|nr:ATP-binding protein [Niastella yeongjuensis]OQP49006.1 AAA family ATPase [Niastella yeongjuensis]SEP10188.1 ATPase family associated with various cellular activities (AAA) [Niastella yeongjuensis]